MEACESVDLSGRVVTLDRSIVLQKNKLAGLRASLSESIAARNALEEEAQTLKQKFHGVKAQLLTKDEEINMKSREVVALETKISVLTSNMKHMMHMQAIFLAALQGPGDSDDECRRSVEDSNSNDFDGICDTSVSTLSGPSASAQTVIHEEQHEEAQEQATPQPKEVSTTVAQIECNWYAISCPFCGTSKSIRSKEPLQGLTGLTRHIRRKHPHEGKIDEEKTARICTKDQLTDDEVPRSLRETMGAE